METIGTVLTAWFCTWSNLHYANNPIEGRTRKEQWLVMANYRKALADIPISRLDAACRSLTQNIRFFPKPADIRKEIESDVYVL
jgi:hypothetical protein